MIKSVIALLIGVALTCIGAARSMGAPPSVSIADRDLELIYVAAGGACDAKCKVPQPDCPDFGCQADPADATKCESKDDTSWWENNHCVAAPGEQCVLQDWGVCYTHTVCTKNPFFNCDYNNTLDCGWPHSNCGPTDVSSYDDCTDSTGVDQ